VIEVRKSLLVPYTTERMFDLIERAEDYPAFLPWCASATILSRSDDAVAAAITVDYRGVRFHFTTRNPKRRPDWLAIRLESGPFRRFEGEWHLAPLGDAGCRIRFDLHYEFASTMMRTLAGPIFGRIADTLVDAFVARADEVYAAIVPPALIPPAPGEPTMPMPASIAPIPAGIAAAAVTIETAGTLGPEPARIPAAPTAEAVAPDAAPSASPTAGRESNPPLSEGATPHA
jgi:ribosome-associated toxin RatA of RatAB toxin-antitoxin module